MRERGDTMRTPETVVEVEARGSEESMDQGMIDPGMAEETVEIGIAMMIEIGNTEEAVRT